MADSFPYGSPPAHIIVDDGLSERPDDLPDVSSVFGKPYELEGKLLIPVAVVQRVMVGAKMLSFAKAKALIEVGDDEVRVREIIDPAHLIFPGMAIVAWLIYWLFRPRRISADRD